MEYYDVNMKAISNGKNMNGVFLRWLGQAGFSISYHGIHLLVDPYLSDFLAKKYAGTAFPHKRLMPPPMPAETLVNLDCLLCTHRHSDHLDPETVPVLIANNPTLKLVAPRAEERYIRELGIAPERVVFVNDGERFDLAPGIKLEVVASAHEDLKRDANGNFYYLGYILRFGETGLYHSGDCVPFDDLPRKLRGINSALLPVNGRDEFRRSRGIPGNFTFEEAVELCRKAKIPRLICHHFGMFAFNTVQRSELIEKAKKLTDVRVVVPEWNDSQIID